MIPTVRTPALRELFEQVDDCRALLTLDVLGAVLAGRAVPCRADQVRALRCDLTAVPSPSADLFPVWVVRPGVHRYRLLQLPLVRAAYRFLQRERQWRHRRRERPRPTGVVRVGAGAPGAAVWRTRSEIRSGPSMCDGNALCPRSSFRPRDLRQRCDRSWTVD